MHVNKKNENRECGRWNLICLLAILVIGIIHIIRYLFLGSVIPLITICIIEILFFSVAYTAWKTGILCLYLPIAVTGIILFYTTDNFETTMFNVFFLVQAVISCVAVLGGIYSIAAKKISIKKPSVAVVLTALILLGITMGCWAGNTMVQKKSTEPAEKSIWSVPEQYDAEECVQQGTVEEIVYQTKAYATDERTVEKRALVYLPYGYDENESYNILYLMHGTGDNEEYWLRTNAQNKKMIDWMIYNGDINPLIIVTPTFYVEDDCSDGLDPLTYSFKEELRNDLMPAVESKYSTYAKECTDDGFKDSRDHRAFAGLSRGAVTMYHSVLCGSLDYFSWFGAFSGSRTSTDYFKETIQSEEFKDYPINYLYVSSGNFDFAMPGQIQDYKNLLKIEPRLSEGVNTTFDMYPMRYHSIGSWHLALYNFLQTVF
mgnify:CR=1 FL=1